MRNVLRKHAKEIGLIVLISVMSFGTHFYRYDYPHEIVFDEVHFAGFTSNYLSHKYYFDIHPPLAKILFAETTKVLGLSQDPSFEYKSIGDEFTNNKEFHTAIRILVTFFGFLLPILIYFLTRVLFNNPFPAFIAAFLAVFENSLIVHSRYILTDIFLLDFGVLGMALYLLARKRDVIWQKYSLFTLSGFFLGASVAVKWTALIFVGVMGLLALYDLYKSHRLQQFFFTSVSVLATGFAVYVMAFAIHLNNLTDSGPGDAFMSAEFQATLNGNANYGNENLERPGFFRKFGELNVVMFFANKGITAEHSYGSDWYSWPFLGRTVYYWNKAVTDPAVIANKTSENGEGVFAFLKANILGEQEIPQDTMNQKVEERIYLLGNPVVYWVGFAVMAFLTFHILSLLYLKTYHKKVPEPFFIPLALICIGYWANLLPYAAISRVSFLYHYFPSLIFLFAGTGFFFWRYFGTSKRLAVPATFLCMVLIAYFFFFPITYALPLTNSEFDFRMFIKGWI